MSTPNPFAQEEQSQLETMPLWNPETAAPKWYDGLGASEETAYLGPFYRVLNDLGNGAAAGEAMLAGVWHAEDAAGARYLGNVPGLGTYFREKAKGDEEMMQDARERVRATTPDPATTGTAVQVIHGVVSGAYRATVGSLAGGPLAGAGALGGSEAVNRFEELKEHGVDTGTATASAGLAGVTSGAGALLPGGFGSNLLTRLLTGAGANVGMGLANRYADHKILDAGGYQEMADQQRVLDGTQLAADAILGAAFGSLAHVHAAQGEKSAFARQLPAWGQASGATDAARTLQVALRDRAAAPGVPVDPASAAAHQEALEKAQTDLLSGQRVDVSDTAVHDAQFLTRPSPGAGLGEEIVANSLREAGVLGEEQSLKDLEEQLAARLRGEKPAGQAPMQTPAESKREAPIAQFRRDAAVIEQGLPAPAEGHTRLWRGGVPNEQGATRFTNDLPGIALPFRKAYGGALRYVDIPNSRLAEFEERVGAAPGAEFRLPPDLAGMSSVVPEAGAPRADAAAFVRDFEQRNPQSPEEPAERLVNGNTRVGITVDPVDPTTAHIETVRALQTGEGAGTKAMEHIAELADQHGVRLTLHADPLDVAGIGSRKLIDWYKRFGFRITHHVSEGALMERPPGGAPEAALLPEPHELESVGAEHSLDNAYAAALTARAAQIEPDRVWQLAEKHEGDTEAFIREVQAIVDRHEATRAGGEEGATAAAGHKAGERGPAAGNQQSAATGASGLPGAASPGARVPGPESAVDRLAASAITDRSGMQIPDDDGLKPAQQALQQTDNAATLGEQETPRAITAAIDCFLRRGG